MASPGFALDYQGHLTAFLLRDFLSKLSPGPGALDARAALEAELERIGPEVLAPLNRFFESLPLTLAEVGAAEWYLNFLAGRSRDWLPNPAVRAASAMRFAGLPHEPVAIRALEVALLLDYVEGRPGADCEAARYFSERPLFASGGFTRDGRLAAQTLMSELPLDSAVRQQRRPVAYGPFILDAARAVFRDSQGAVPPAVAASVAALAEGISPARRAAIVQFLVSPSPRS
jgi:hypothetical protein